MRRGLIVFRGIRKIVNGSSILSEITNQHGKLRATLCPQFADGFCERPPELEDTTARTSAINHHLTAVEGKPLSSLRPKKTTVKFLSTEDPDPVCENKGILAQPGPLRGGFDGMPHPLIPRGGSWENHRTVHATPLERSQREHTRLPFLSRSSGI